MVGQGTALWHDSLLPQQLYCADGWLVCGKKESYGLTTRRRHLQESANMSSIVAKMEAGKRRHVRRS